MSRIPHLHGFILIGLLARYGNFQAHAAPTPSPVATRAVPLFDGRTLSGWEGSPGVWKVEDGCIVGGSPKLTLKQNEFLATTGRHTNFIFRARFKLTGTGFVNSGVQMRSERVPGTSEMAGYQCDIGDPTWWASLYDESRRNRVLAWSDMGSIEKKLKRDDWNDYVIRADGRRITTWMNGVLGVDYFEPDDSIIGSGRIGFQVHAGGEPVARFRDITIETLPPTPALQGAGVPPAAPHASPLSPEEQQATFSVPPGFKVELVAAEPDGGKFVAVQFDHAGRMWAMTALEYPLDANEAGAEAKALFEKGGRDRVLVFDTPTAPGRQTARTFADGLVMPLGVLPYKGGAYVQYGDAVRYYSDTDHDGKADGFTNVLTGFGIEDSHLFPHQFTRAPGGWFWLAQGAFNYSKVKSSTGEVVEYNKTKLARWRPDGSRFETIGWGPCNIWGLVLDRHGEAFIQEANDQGWPLMPFLEGGSYPLCGDDVPRPYAPPFPKTGEKEMGGTGLSGLALSEGGDSFPGPWRDVFFVNNPITQKVQAIRVHRGSRGSVGEEPSSSQSAIRDPQSAIEQSRLTSAATDYGNGWQLEHLPDFMLSSDPWFRPVAMTFGPDGCLYVVDWYNKIISHNEVPRKHPERDKTRGRVWRIRHESQPHRAIVPDLYKASDKALLGSLKAAGTWEVGAAWQEITDRKAVSLAPDLAKLAGDEKSPADLRIRSLWCLEGLQKVDAGVLRKLFASSHRSVRKEALRAAGAQAERSGDGALAADLAKRGLQDPDRLVRQEAIRVLAALLADPRAQGSRGAEIVGILAVTGATAPAGDWAKAPGFFRDFERYLVRSALEKQPALLGRWLAIEASRPTASVEARAFAALAMGGAEGAKQFAALLPRLSRALAAEELLLVAAASGEPAAAVALRSALKDPANLRLLHGNRARLKDHAALAPLLTEAVRSLVARDGSDANHALLALLAGGFKLGGLEPEIIAAATRPGAKPDGQLAAIRALRESGSVRVDVLRRLADSGDEAVRREAVAALAGAKSDAAVPALLELWPSLSSVLRKTVVDRLSGSPATARQLVAAIGSGAVARDELDGYALDKLATVLPDDAAVKGLVADIGSSLKPVLHLSGGDADHLDAELTLAGPATVECWVKLAPGVHNEDSLLGAPGGIDANFFGGRFRVWIAGGSDIVVATKPTVADAWTHVAFTRDAEGTFRIYLDGELNATSSGKDPRKFDKLTPFRSTAAGGTSGDFAEYRVWSTCRSADEIRAAANLALPAGTPGLVFTGTGASWGKLHGAAKVERSSDLPPVQTPEQAKALDMKFARFRVLAEKDGDRAGGQQVFTATCGVCHTVKGVGGKIGPVLDGAGASGVEALLRNVITPDAAMEAGYRRFRVETKDGEVVEGLLAAQDAGSVTVRQPGIEDQRFARAGLKRAGFIKGSVMPGGLLDALRPEQVSDLFAYLKTLK